MIVSSRDKLLTNSWRHCWITINWTNLVAHESWEGPSNFVVIHVRRDPWREEDKDESDRKRNLHQVRHDDAVVQPDQPDQRFLERVQCADKGHRALGPVLQLGHDVVSALSRCLFVQFTERLSRRKTVFAHISLKQESTRLRNLFQHRINIDSYLHATLTMGFSIV